eukprot:7533593-Prorocentrum_lima.AAC.1
MPECRLKENKVVEPYLCSPALPTLLAGFSLTLLTQHLTTKDGGTGEEGHHTTLKKEPREERR